MCHHPLNIYLTCGHTSYTLPLLRPCLFASIPPNGSFSTTCRPISHPFHTKKIYSLCKGCLARREILLRGVGEVVERRGVRVEEVRWRVRYGVDAVCERVGERTEKEGRADGGGESEGGSTATGGKGRERNRRSWRKRVSAVFTGGRRGRSL